MKSKDLTQGSIFINIILFTIPILIGNLFQQVYNLTDTWVVGVYLENGISAIGASSGIYDLILNFANGMTLGFAIYIAQCFGEKNEEKKRRSIMYTAVLTIIITIVVTLITLLSLKPIMHALNTPEEIFNDAYVYIFVICAGMITTMLYNMFTAMMRSAGNSLIALICLIVSVCLNIALDLMFVIVFKWGMLGVALATVVSQALAAIFCFLYILIKMPELHAGFKDLKKDIPLLKNMLLLGFSMGFMFSIVALGSLIQQGAINSLGTDIITAHSIARKLSSIFMSLVSASASTAGTFTGQNYGANKLVRVRKGILANFYVGFFWSAISLLIVYVFGRQLVMALGSLKEEDSLIIDTAVKYLKINLPFYAVLAVLSILRMAMQAMGFKVTPSISSGLELGVKVLIAFVFTSLLGYHAIIIGEPIIWIICTIILCAAFVSSDIGRKVLTAKELTNDNAIENGSLL